MIRYAFKRTSDILSLQQRVNNLLLRSSETFRQRCRRKRQADIQRTHHLLETRIGEQYPQQGPLDLLRQLRLALYTNSSTKGR